MITGDQRKARFYEMMRMLLIKWEEGLTMPQLEVLNLSSREEQVVKGIFQALRLLEIEEHLEGHYETSGQIDYI